MHWNTLLQRWVMVYASWPAAIYITTSEDALHWEVPQLIVDPVDETRVRYPTIISESGDLIAGT